MTAWGVSLLLAGLAAAALPYSLYMLVLVVVTTRKGWC